MRHQDCRLVYNRLPSPRKMQTLVQVWKQLRKWRSGGESVSSFQQENKRPVMGSLKSAARLNNRRQLRICKKVSAWTSQVVKAPLWWLRRNSNTRPTDDRFSCHVRSLFLVCCGYAAVESSSWSMERICSRSSGVSWCPCTVFACRTASSRTSSSAPEMTNRAGISPTGNGGNRSLCGVRPLCLGNVEIIGPSRRGFNPSGFSFCRRVGSRILRGCDGKKARGRARLCAWYGV